MKKKITFFKTLLLVLTLLVGSMASWGQTPFTATYTFTGTTGDVASFSYNGVLYDGITMGTIVKVGITSASSTSNSRATVWPTGATTGSDVFSGSVDLGKYIGFTITPVSGYKYTVTSITFGIGRSATGIRQSQWRGSADSYVSIINNYTTVNAGLTNSSGVLTNPDTNSSWTGNVLSVGSSYSNITSSAGFRLYLYNSEASTGTGGLQGPITITGTFEAIGGVSAPTSQASAINFTSINQTGMTANWTNGDGAKRVVIMNTSNSFTTPTDGTDPTANAVYGGSGEQVVYNNSSNSVAVTGLSASTTYWYRVYEYNGSGATTKFFADAATGNPNSQATNAPTPTITLTPTTLTGFTYVQGSGPSSEQTFTVSGSNLTNDISIASSPNYEISKSSGTGYTTPLTFTQSGGSVAETTVYVRLKSGLSTGNFNSEIISATSTDASEKTVTCSGSVTAPEPTNHATSFTATTNSASQITITWTDAIGGQVPDGYLVKASTNSPTAPMDGTAEVDATLVKNIAQGAQTAVFTGLSASTTYNFSIWPYTNSGASIDYKTDGIVPTANATTSAPAIVTYTWNQTSSSPFSTASNWTPNRTTPATTDILVFDNGATTTVTGITTQTIGGLSVSNGTKVTLNSSGAAATLTINNGMSGNDLSIASNCELNIAQTTSNSALIIALATGATGSVSGSMDFSSTTASTPNQITAADASGLTFNSGAVLTQNTNNTGNILGSGTANSVIFANGSAFVQYGGSNPFQKTAPASVVVFQTGSLFKLKTTNSPAFNGRTYANFEYDYLGSNTVTGTSAVVMDNLTVTNGTFNFNMTGTPGHSIKGNITVASGATVTFTPSSAGTVNLNGSALQTISGGGTINTGTNSTLAIDNATGVVLDNNASLTGNLTITSGALSVNYAKQLTIYGTLINNGTLNLLSDATGTATILTPASIGGGGTATVQQYLTSGRNWYLSMPISSANVETFSTATSVSTWNESIGDWATISAGSAINPLTGYISVATNSDGPITFSGSLNNGDQSVNVTRTAGVTKEGFNLIGNPYPSYFNPCSLITGLTKLEPTIWYRTKNASYTFETVNTSSGIGTNIGNNASGPVTGYIAPMQAFWVRVQPNIDPLANNSETLTFTNAMRSHAGTGNILLKSRATTDNQLVRLQVSNGTNNDETVLYSNPSAQNGLDAYDSPKMTNGNTSIPEIYTLSDSKELVINGMNSIALDTEIPLGFRPGKIGNDFSIKSTELLNFDSNVHVMLKDSQLHTETDITNDSAYSFSTTDTIATTSRFSIIFRLVGTTTGTNNAANNGGIIVTKNANNQIIIRYANNLSGEGSATVYNAIGQKIVSKQLNSNITVLNNIKASGVYIVTVQISGKCSTQKIIVD